MLKQLMYFAYYIKKTNKKTFYTYFNYVKKQTGMSSSALYADIVRSCLKYNVSFTDYFLFRFFEKDTVQQESYAGTAFMYEYQLKMNPVANRSVLENKIQFLDHFKEFSGRKWATLRMIEKDPEIATAILNNPAGKVVVKDAGGQAGADVEVLSTAGLDAKALIRKMRNGKFDLVEGFVLQHKAIMELSSSALNTLRVISQLTDNGIDIIAAIMRVSVNSNVDNMSAGNFAAPVNLETGEICGPGVYMDLLKEDTYIHPVSKVNLIGFKIPFWQESINLVKQASLKVPGNRSIGWDVAITDEGPILIEGNHNWGKLLWQLPFKKGLKKDILKYYS